MTRGITAKFAPKSAPIRAPGQVFSKSFTPIPLLKQRNSFSDFENTPLFACRRRSTENSPVSPMRPISSAEAHPSARRGYADNLRSGHIRARDNRGIRPEICPNIRTARNFFENFKKISFSVQRKGKKYRLYNIRDNHGEYLHPERRRGGAPLCVRAKLHRESESACATINAACAKSVGKAPDVYISSQIFTPNAAPDRTASSESGIYSIRAFPYCKIRQSML